MGSTAYESEQEGAALGDAPAQANVPGATERDEAPVFDSLDFETEVEELVPSEPVLDADSSELHLDPADADLADAPALEPGDELVIDDSSRVASTEPALGGAWTEATEPAAAELESSEALEPDRGHDEQLESGDPADTHLEDTSLEDTSLEDTSVGDEDEAPPHPGLTVTAALTQEWPLSVPGSSPTASSAQSDDDTKLDAWIESALPVDLPSSVPSQGTEISISMPTRSAETEPHDSDSDTSRIAEADLREDTPIEDPSPELEAPDLETPDLETPDFQTPDFEDPDFEASAFENSDVEDSDFEDSVQLSAPIQAEGAQTEGAESASAELATPDETPERHASRDDPASTVEMPPVSSSSMGDDADQPSSSEDLRSELTHVSPAVGPGDKSDSGDSGHSDPYETTEHDQWSLSPTAPPAAADEESSSRASVAASAAERAPQLLSQDESEGDSDSMRSDASLDESVETTDQAPTMVEDDSTNEPEAPPTDEDTGAAIRDLVAQAEATAEPSRPTRTAAAAYARSGRRRRRRRSGSVGRWLIAAATALVTFGSLSFPWWRPYAENLVSTGGAANDEAVAAAAAEPEPASAPPPEAAASAPIDAAPPPLAAPPTPLERLSTANQSGDRGAVLSARNDLLSEVEEMMMGGDLTTARNLLAEALAVLPGDPELQQSVSDLAWHARGQRNE